MAGGSHWMERRAWIVAAVVAVVVVVAVPILYVLRLDDGADEIDASPVAPSPVDALSADALPTDEPAPAETPGDAGNLSPTPPTVESVTPPAVPAPEPVVLPPLAESDVFVRERIAAELGAAGAAWLAEPDLVARAAAVIAGGVDGNIPTRLLRFARPPGAFAVAEAADGTITIAPRTFVRFNAWVETATAIPPPRVAELVLLLEPLLAQALVELGRDETPRAPIVVLLDQVLATPAIDDPIVVERPGALYRFSDPALEARTPLQKQLLRMGAANVRVLRVYARALRWELTQRQDP